MRSTGGRVGVVAAVIAVAVVLFIVLSDGDDGGGDSNGGSATQVGAPGTVTQGSGGASEGPLMLTVKDGEPVGGVETLTYTKGEQVNLEVRLNRPEEAVHVHGYEIEKPAEHSPVRLSFPARLDGIFEIDVHGADGNDTQIAQLRVNP